MKYIPTIAILITLISCASMDTSRIAPGYKQAFSSIDNIIFGFEENIDMSLISNIPYASMLVRIGKGPSALMILESVSNENFTWVSADGVYLITSNGRIVKTSGLPNNLTEEISTVKSWDQDIYNDQSFYSYRSYKKPVLNNLRVISSFKKGEIQNLELVSGPRSLRLIEQSMVAPEIGWSTQNNYWIDESNYTWKSVQYISPKLPPIYLEITKKPR